MIAWRLEPVVCQGQDWCWRTRNIVWGTQRSVPGRPR